ncbi:helix-turn-helix transcriptional regulator [Calidifontibacillus erzurumensis]|uniref:helix-turn-helix transcriptional regulator n=1 Tax=Calidifontibacillus erzurumensis TaxID=2741433 RepID=UPI0035B4FD3F
MSKFKTQKVERLFYIINYLNNHENATAKELAVNCNTSIRNIYRDIRELENLGFYITNEGKNGYKLIHQPIKRSHQLTFNEWTALILYPLFTDNIASKDHPLHHAYRSGIEKITGTFYNPENVLSISSELGERILFQDQYRDSFHPEIMSVIIESIVRNKSIQVSYYSMHRDTITNRTIDPYYLVPRGGHLYLIAYCHFRENVLVFRINRFRAAEIKDHTFKIPKEFNILDYLSNRWSILADDNQTTNFVVKFHKDVARYINEYDFYTDTVLEEQDDGSLLLKTTVRSKSEFIRWVRSYGLNAEILEPKEVREQLREEHKQLLKKYSN